MHYYLLIVDENESIVTQEGPFDTASERDEMAEEMADDPAGMLVWLNVTTAGVLKSGTYSSSDEDDDDDDDDEDEDDDDLDLSKEDSEDETWS